MKRYNVFNYIGEYLGYIIAKNFDKAWIAAQVKYPLASSIQLVTPSTRELGV